MRFRVLGPVEVSDGAGIPVALVGSRQRLLMVCLLARAGEVVTADRLAECLWGEGQPSDPVAALQSQVSRLRQRLGAGAGLETVSGGYRLRPAEDGLDAVVFERLVSKARTVSDPVVALRLVDSALGLWRGPAYGEHATEPEMVAASEHLEGLRVAVREQRAGLLLALGRPEEAAAVAAVLVREQPLRERAVEILVEACSEAGRASEALTAYESYRVRLAEELGVDPGAELRRLHLGILRGEADIARARARATMPRPVTSYVGRDDGVGHVAQVVRDSRLVTLTGPGGVGKTRLAVEVANRLAEELPDGAWFCDLAAVADAAAVPAAVASVLGVQRRHDRSFTERLVEVLGGWRVLLVLDNCEHLRDAVALLAQQILERTAKVHVLATSREPLGIPGEHRFGVEPLGEQEGARLFADRARAVRPGLALSAEAGGAAVARICREVAGLPLGIELAAARAAARSPTEIADDLAGRVDRLSAPRPGPVRHRSVAAVVDWSLDRLSESEQDLAEHLAVFAGGCTAESAAAVCRRDVAETTDLLVGLVERSVVTPRPMRGNTRYVLLEPVRARAEKRLQQRVLLAAARRAHGGYFAGLTARASEGLRTSEAAHWLQTLDDEFANLRAACSWSQNTDGGHTALQLLAPLYFYDHARMPSELSEWAEAASAAPAAAGHPAQSETLVLSAMAARRRGDLVQARRLAEQATRTAASTGARVQALRASGFFPFYEGRPHEAIEPFGTARAAARAAGDTFMEVLIEVDIALARGYGSDEGAAAAADAACVRAEALDAPMLLAYATYVAGEVRLTGSPKQALALLRRAVQVARSAGHDFIVTAAAMSATSIEVRHSGPEATLSELAGLLDEWQRAGAWHQSWLTLRLCVGVFVRLGEVHAAAHLIGAMHATTNAGPLYGDDAKRLAQIESTLRSQLASYDSLMSNGATLGDDGAVTLARRTLNALMQSAPIATPTSHPAG